MKKRGKIIIAVLSVVLAGILGAIGYLLWQGSRDDREYESQLKLYAENLQDTSLESGNYLADALSINSDTVAWIRIPDTEIDFPVVYSGDNSYYLNHSFEKEYSQLGTPFLDYRCSSDFSDYNSIIYGHHIKGGRMFAALDSFKSEDYFINHSTGSLITNDRIYTVHFVACLVCESDGAAYTVVFLNEDEKTAYLEKLRSKALVLKDFETDELLEKRLITLSTCSYEYEDARTVLIGWLE